MADGEEIETFFGFASSGAPIYLVAAPPEAVQALTRRFSPDFSTDHRFVIWEISRLLANPVSAKSHAEGAETGTRNYDT
jgi:hypothetical protein